MFIQIDNEINEKINIAISNTQNENFKRVPEYINYNYEDISNAIKKTESNVISKKDKEINLLSIRNNLNKLQNNLSNIVLNFAYHIEHNKEKILMNNFIVEKVTSIIAFFFFLDWLSRKTIKIVAVRNIFYFIIALLATFLILNDIKYVDYLMPYASKINSKIFMGAFFVLIVALGFFLEKEYDDKYKTVRLSKAILEIIFVVLFLKLYQQNSDFDEKFRFFIAMGACLLYFWFIIKRISTEFNIKVASLITYICLIYIF